MAGETRENTSRRSGGRHVERSNNDGTVDEICAIRAEGNRARVRDQRKVDGSYGGTGTGSQGGGFRVVRPPPTLIDRLDVLILLSIGYKPWNYVRNTE